MHVLWESDRWLRKHCVSNTSEVSSDLDTSKDGASKEVTDSENKAVAASGGGGSVLADDFESEQFHSKPRSLMCGNIIIPLFFPVFFFQQQIHNLIN